MFLTFPLKTIHHKEKRCLPARNYKIVILPPGESAGLTEKPKTRLQEPQTQSKYWLDAEKPMHSSVHGLSATNRTRLEPDEKTDGNRSSLKGKRTGNYPRVGTA